MPPPLGTPPQLLRSRPGEAAQRDPPSPRVGVPCWESCVCAAACWLWPGLPACVPGPRFMPALCCPPQASSSTSATASGTARRPPWPPTKQGLLTVTWTIASDTQRWPRRRRRQPRGTPRRPRQHLALPTQDPPPPPAPTDPCCHGRGRRSLGPQLPRPARPSSPVAGQLRGWDCVASAGHQLCSRPSEQRDSPSAGPLASSVPLLPRPWPERGSPSLVTPGVHPQGLWGHRELRTPDTQPPPRLAPRGHPGCPRSPAEQEAPPPPSLAAQGQPLP